MKSHCHPYPRSYRAVAVCVTVLAMIAIPVPLHAERVSAERLAALKPEAGAAFNVLQFDVQRLEVPLEVGSGFTLTVVLDGRSHTLELRPHSVLAPSYRLIAQMEDGSFVDLPPGPVNTFRGTVADLPDSVVSGGLTGQGLRAKVILSDNTIYWIEPLQPLVDRAQDGEHIIYRAADALPSGGTCGVTHADELLLGNTLPQFDGGLGRASCGASTCVAELACDADFEYFQDYGSVANVESRITSVINTVNVQYERDVSITHTITAILVRTAEPDPYSATDPGSLLSQFANDWNANHGDIQRDVAHLFTGKNLDGSVIGIAWLSVICTSSAYSLVQSDCCGSFSCATDLSAHELGHNWGADHCACTSHTMNPSLVCANQFHPTETIPEIIAFRDSRTCLNALESGTTTLPFFDDFPSTTIDDTKWTGVQDAEVNTVATNEVSPPNSLNLDGSALGGDQVRSAIMDTTFHHDLDLSYWYERTGGGNSPESGEDLVVEYLADNLVWTELNRHLGSGADMNNFEFVSLALPADAQHDSFRVRFRAISSNNGADDWFIDDVGIAGVIDDCNANSIPDQLDISGGTSQDCQPNGTPDECELAGNDCNGNGRPDECDTDCNGNGIADTCDIAAGTSFDCTANNTPDECEFDCNGNGRRDDCDISGGTSTDCNGNGVPDECDVTTCYTVWDGFQPNPPFSFNRKISEIDYDSDGLFWENPADTGIISIIGCETLGFEDNALKVNVPSSGPPEDGFVKSEFFHTTAGQLDEDALVYRLSFQPKIEQNLDTATDWQLSILDGTNDQTVITIQFSATNSFLTGFPGFVVVQNPAGPPQYFNTGVALTLDTCMSFEVVYQRVDRTVQLYIDGQPTLDPSIAPLGLQADRLDYLRIQAVPNASGGVAATVFSLDDVHLCLTSVGEVPPGQAPDCNANSVLDECDITAGTSTDCDGNGTPDECETLSLGDYDDDGDVDLIDYQTMQGCFTGPGGGPLDTGCGQGDFDCDDDIDLDDFAAFQRVFGT